MRTFRPTHEVNGVPVVRIGAEAWTKRAFETGGKPSFHIDQRSRWFDSEGYEDVFATPLLIPDEEKIALRFEEKGRDEQGIDLFSQPLKSKDFGVAGRVRMRVSFNGEVSFFLGPDYLGPTEKEVLSVLWRDGFEEDCDL